MCRNPVFFIDQILSATFGLYQCLRTPEFVTIFVYVYNENGLLRPIFTFLFRQQPLEAIVIL